MQAQPAGAATLPRFLPPPEPRQASAAAPGTPSNALSEISAHNAALRAGGAAPSSAVTGSMAATLSSSAVQPREDLAKPASQPNHNGTAGPSPVENTVAAPPRQPTVPGATNGVSTDASQSQHGRPGSQPLEHDGAPAHAANGATNGSHASTGSSFAQHSTAHVGPHAQAAHSHTHAADPFAKTRDGAGGTERIGALPDSVMAGTECMQLQNGGSAPGKGGGAVAPASQRHDRSGAAQSSDGDNAPGAAKTSAAPAALPPTSVDRVGPTVRDASASARSSDHPGFGVNSATGAPLHQTAIANADGTPQDAVWHLDVEAKRLMSLVARDELRVGEHLSAAYELFGEALLPWLPLGELSHVVV